MCILNNYVELVSFFCTISLSYICIHYFYAGLLFFIVIRSFLKFTKPPVNPKCCCQSTDRDDKASSFLSNISFSSAAPS